MVYIDITSCFLELKGFHSIARDVLKTAQPRSYDSFTFEHVYERMSKTRVNVFQFAFSINISLRLVQHMFFVL